MTDNDSPTSVRCIAKNEIRKRSRIKRRLEILFLGSRVESFFLSVRRLISGDASGFSQSSTEFLVGLKVA